MDRVEFVAKAITERDNLLLKHDFEKAMQLFVYTLAIIDNQSARNMIHYYNDFLFNKNSQLEKETHTLLAKL